MEIKIMILFIFLLTGSFLDLKNRTIPVIFCYGGLVAIIAACILDGEIAIMEALGGMLIGICLLGIGKLTKEQVGFGDGIVFVITGLGLGIWNNLLLLFEALFLSFLWSLLFLMTKRISLKTKLPFLPFIFVAFVFEFVLKV